MSNVIRSQDGQQPATASNIVIALIALAFFGSGSLALAANDVAPPGRSVAYVINEIVWAVYQTKDGKEECPDGVNTLGPREQFKAQFPDDGVKRTFAETQLAREAKVWWPTVTPDQFPFHEASGKTAPGLNLDGKTGPNDFTSPDGKSGIDNQLYRVIGCVVNYRDGASILNFEKIFLKKMQIERILIVLTDVDSLLNDDDVTITTYRGRDSLMTDATGNGFVPGGTQRLDLRWGKEFIHQAKGKIVNGVLVTAPLDFFMPHEVAYQSAAYYWLRDARFELNLTQEKAAGLIGGYADIEHFYFGRNREWSTHHRSYGQEASASVYSAMRRLADAYPDPQTGEYTAISAAFKVQMVRVNVLPDVASSAINLAGDGTRVVARAK
jgi:hypothetical protein